MSAITISLEENGAKGRYVAQPAGHKDAGEMTFSRVSATKIIVDHTEVPDSLRGLGVGVALAERVVADAREKGFQIVPLCPFFNAQAKRHPDWSDVVIGL